MYDRIVFDDPAFGAGSGEAAEAIDGHPEAVQGGARHLLPRAEFFQEHRHRIVAAALDSRKLLATWKKMQEERRCTSNLGQMDPHRIELTAAFRVARLNGPIDQAKEEMKFDNTASKKEGKLPQGRRALGDYVRRWARNRQGC
jgi:hypothetical protein